VLVRLQLGGEVVSLPLRVVAGEAIGRCLLGGVLDAPLKLLALVAIMAPLGP